MIAHFNSSWRTRVRRDDLLTLHVDGTHGSAVAGLQDVVTQQRMDTPKPVWNPDIKQPIDFYDGWQPVPETQVFDNGFKLQWEAFIRHVVRRTRPTSGTCSKAPRACSSSNARCGAGRSAAGSTCRS